MSKLLCEGVPLELVGDFPGSALQQAITSDRPRITCLLLACGASITHSSQGLNLLQQAWYSPNTTSRVHSAILTVSFGREGLAGQGIKLFLLLLGLDLCGLHSCGGGTLISLSGILTPAQEREGSAAPSHYQGTA